MTKEMEDNAKLIEELLEKAAEYGKIKLELVKLKTLDKTSDVASSAISHSVVILLVAIFILFLNLGAAFWLGGILGNTCYGFLVVASFYGIIGLILHFFMHNWLKKHIGNFIVRKVLK